ncbi:MAG: hypothetical protein B1H03_06060 [Planctomycetales bacterium 4484_113]|nr:MAG: hypothetical protein B1H03_06060 [Planctomycetales bacterium 4484_113]
MSDHTSTTTSRARKSTETDGYSRLPALAKALFRRALSFIGTPRAHWASLQRLYQWILRAGFSHFGAHYNYARNLHQHGKYDEAAKHYRKAIELKPDFAEAYNNLGIVLCELGHYVESEASLQQSLQLRPHPYPHCNLGDLYSRQGRFEAAEAELLAALKMKPDFAAAIYTLAQVLAKTERFEEAEQMYRQALELAPEDAEIHEDFANLLIQLDHLQEAKHHLEEALTLRLAAKPESNPLDQWIEQSRAYYQTRRSKRNYGSKR